MTRTKGPSTIGAIMKSIRAFIALTLPSQVAETLAAVSQELAPRVPDGAVKWVEPERIHLTLRFLGNTPVDRLDALGSALEAVAGIHNPFSLSLDRLGCFPNERRPRVIWVGLDGQVDALRRLKEDLDEALSPLGWEPEDKRFRAHLTLGRVKRQHREIELPWGTPVVPAAWQVGGLHLIESQLRPAGPLYTIRHSGHLAGATG